MCFSLSLSLLFVLAVAAAAAAAAAVVVVVPIPLTSEFLFQLSIFIIWHCFTFLPSIFFPLIYCPMIVEKITL